MICALRLCAVPLVILTFSYRYLQTVCYMMCPACLFSVISCHTLPVSRCASHIDLLLVSHTYQGFLPQGLHSAAFSSWKMPPQTAHMASSFSVFRL